MQGKSLKNSLPQACTDPWEEQGEGQHHADAQTLQENRMETPKETQPARSGHRETSCGPASAPGRHKAPQGQGVNPAPAGGQPPHSRPGPALPRPECPHLGWAQQEPTGSFLQGCPPQGKAAAEDSVAPGWAWSSGLPRPSQASRLSPANSTQVSGGQLSAPRSRPPSLSPAQGCVVDSPGDFTVPETAELFLQVPLIFST